IDELPVEVLQEIFAFYILSVIRTRFTGFAVWSTIMHVCARWRDALIGHPRLWTRI
ncbi:hypothetical protein NEOLEDRAFT_1035904, partial [Neolentinus lepideus HHB14362 ss-1]